MNLHRLIYLLLARCIAAWHMTFILFVLIGGLIAFPFNSLMIFHMICVFYGVINRKRNMGCFLTKWDRSLRVKAGETLSWPMDEFMPHYIWSHFNRTGYEPSSRKIFMWIMILANFIPYLIFLNRILS